MLSNAEPTERAKALKGGQTTLDGQQSTRDNKDRFLELPRLSLVVILSLRLKINGCYYTHSTRPNNTLNEVLKY